MTGGGGGIGGATCRRFASRRRHGRGVGPLRGGGEKVAGCDSGGRRPRRGVPLRHHRPRRRGCGGGGDRGEARPGRRPGQQRRLGRLQAFIKTEPAQWEQADRHQPDRRTAHASRGAAGHGGAKVRPHRQHRVRCRARRLVGRSGLRGLQGRHRRLFEDHRTRHARHGITVNVVCPGPTATALFAEDKKGAGNPEKLVEAFRHPLGRIGQPDELPGAILSSPATMPRSSRARCSASPVA